MSQHKADESYQVYEIPIDEIWVDDDFNSRIIITKEDVDELAEKIKDAGRLNMPVEVQPAKDVEDIPEGFKYRLIYGYRRTKACKKLGWKTIPAFIKEGLSEREAFIENLSENINRKNLTIMEEALSLDALFPPYKSISSIARELNGPNSWVSVRRNLLLMPKEMQKAAASGRLSSRDIQAIMASNEPFKLFYRILNAPKNKKSYVITKSQKRTKAEVKDVMVRLLDEGFSPHLIRLLGWSIGEIDEKGLNQSLKWLRDRKGWLK